MKNFLSFSFVTTNINKFYIFLFIISSTIVLINIITKSIHVDEGWYHSEAYSKNTYGYYTSPAFYDIPDFNGEIYISRTRLIIQIYRIMDILLNNAEIEIIIIRLLLFFIFVSAFFYYTNKIKFPKNINEKLLVLSFTLCINPIINSLRIARSEIIISSLILFIMGLHHNENENDNFKNKLTILVLSFIMFLFHPNGILFILLSSLLILNKNPLNTLKYWLIVLLFFVAYYLVFIDPNYNIFFIQSRLMFNSGNEQKFCLSIQSIPNYLFSELKYRYLDWNSRIKLSYIIKLISLIFVIILGIFNGIRFKKFRIEIIYVCSTLLFFIFLGNKVSLYLTYVFPLLIIQMIYFLRKKAKILTTVIISFIIINSMITFRGIFWNIKNKTEKKEIIKILEKTTPSGETVYADFYFEPYISSKYKYLTTTQKDKNNFYLKYNIHPQNCIIISEKKNSIWNFVLNKNEILYNYNDIIMKKIY